MSTLTDQLAAASANAAFTLFDANRAGADAFKQDLASAWAEHEPKVFAEAKAGRFNYEFDVLGCFDFSTGEVESMLPPALAKLRIGLDLFIWKCPQQDPWRYQIKIRWQYKHDQIFKQLKEQGAAKDEEAEPPAKKQCTVKEEEEQKPAVEPLPENLEGHDILFLAPEDGWIWANVASDHGAAGLRVYWEAERDVEGRCARVPTTCTKQVARNEIKDHRVATKPVSKQHSHEF